MISLTNYDFHGGRSEVVIIDPDILTPINGGHVAWKPENRGVAIAVVVDLSKLMAGCWYTYPRKMMEFVRLDHHPNYWGK